MTNHIIGLAITLIYSTIGATDSWPHFLLMPHPPAAAAATAAVVPVRLSAVTTPTNTEMPRNAPPPPQPHRHWIFIDYVKRDGRKRGRERAASSCCQRNCTLFSLTFLLLILFKIIILPLVAVVVVSFNKTLGLFATLKDSTTFIFFKIQDEQTLIGCLCRWRHAQAQEQVVSSRVWRRAATGSTHSIFTAA